MSIKIIQNPYSARWASKSKTDEIIETFKSLDLDFDLSITEYPKQATEIAREAVDQGYDTVIAAGGDGTINEVLNGIIGAIGDSEAPKFGILPVGTANDLAANLNIPININEAAKVIASGKTKKIDIIQVNDSYFINNAGLGLEPTTTLIQEEIKLFKGTLRYLIAVLIGIIRNPQWEMELEWDDGEYHGPVTLLSVGNCAKTGGLFYTVPHALPFDGKLSFIHGYVPTRLKILKVFPMILKPEKGNITEHPDVFEIHTTHLKVKTKPGTPAHADGEIIAKSRMDFEYTVHPSRIPILIAD